MGQGSWSLAGSRGWRHYFRFRRSGVSARRAGDFGDEFSDSRRDARDGISYFKARPERPFTGSTARCEEIVAAKNDVAKNNRGSRFHAESSATRYFECPTKDSPELASDQSRASGYFVSWCCYFCLAMIRPEIFL